MSKKLNKKQIERFSRQIILKNIGILGQNKITNAKVLIIGMGGLGCPVAEFLTRSGVGSLGIVDHDRISLSNIHRPVSYTHLRAHETTLHLVCRLLLEKKKK